jgi:hypothetical protein
MMKIRMAFIGLMAACFTLMSASAYAQRDPAICGPGGCWIDITSTQVVQSIAVQTPRGGYTAVFQSDMQVFPSREARGFLQLIPTSRPDDEILVAFVNGNVRFERDGSVAQVILHGRTSAGRPIVVRITPDESQDCLIYTTVGSDVHATWQAPGRLTVNRR